MTQRALLKNTFVAWLPLAVTIVLMTGLVYGAVQQNYRTSADDQQIQNTNEAVKVLATQPELPSGGLSPQAIDMSSSLSPFYIIFDDTGKGSVAIGQLDGQIPTPPSGTFDYVKKHGQYRFTWQPKPGVRIAAVMQHFDGKAPGFFLAGRSLKEIEIREKNLMLLAGGAGLLALILSYLCMLFAVKQMAKVLSHTHGHEGEHHHA